MGFQQGLSGLNASAKHLDTIGNNVANANTVGFKQSQAMFADLYATSLAGSGAVQVGTGVKVSTIAQQFTQGNITNTSNSMDIAISGQGFFRMVDQNGAITYTRNGQFQLDKSGNIVNSQGFKLSGYMATNGIITAAQPVPIQINAADLTPKATANVLMGLNLDSRMALPTITPFDPNNPQSYNSSTSLTVYDSQGSSHVAALYFAKTGPNTWNSYLTVDGNQVPAAGTALTAMTFNTNGVLTSPTLPVTSASFNPVPAPISAVGASVAAGGTLISGPATAGLLVGATVTGGDLPAGTTITAINSANSFTVSAPSPAGFAATTLTVVNPASAGAQTINFDFTGTSQFGGNFGVNTTTQDGFTSGRLSGFTTSPDGTILGRYTNGQSRALGQVVLANFTSPQGLQPLGNNAWAETASSGGPLIGTPGSSSLGVLQSSAVEDSNVDLTAELVNMITAQRVYQANAQTIKTQDQVLQTLVNLR
ncbi:MAG: flagellar hook protein FlgE [Pseudomonadota bacterium]